MKIILVTIIFFYVSPLFGDNVADVLKKADDNYAKVIDYKCLFHKKELVREQYYVAKNIEVKFKKPHSYYMKWTQGEDKGQEVIYSGKRYDYKMPAHTGGWLRFFSININPDGMIARLKTNHPIYQLDIGYLLKLFRSNYKLHKRLQLGSIVFEKEEMLDSIPTLKFKAEFPKDRGFYASKIYVNFDKKNYLPVKIEAYNWNGKLLEMFHFSNIKLNIGLTKKDFDKNNKEYNF